MDASTSTDTAREGRRLELTPAEAAALDQLAAALDGQATAEAAVREAIAAASRAGLGAKRLAPVLGVSPATARARIREAISR